MGGTLSKEYKVFSATYEGKTKKAKKIVSSESIFNRKVRDELLQEAMRGAVTRASQDSYFDENSENIQNVYYWINKTNIFPTLNNGFKQPFSSNIFEQLENYYHQLGYRGIFLKKKIQKLAFRLCMSQSPEEFFAVLNKEIRQASGSYQRRLKSILLCSHLNMGFYTFSMASLPRAGKNKTCMAHHAFFKNPLFDKNVMKIIYEFAVTKNKCRMD
ncbi:MAG TPA: hypothetical protein VHM20_05915 [Gammaproteobacteria bacterium]|jgi:hypothetical protein|nr:hypothetical protein [Gammaproteobacteria bacterium]